MLFCFFVLFQDLDDEFQRKRDFVEQYTPLTKETYGVRKLKHKRFNLKPNQP